MKAVARADRIACMRQPPPPVIDSARILAYAFVDDLAYRQWGKLFVGGRPVEKVPRLAIAVNLGKDIGPLLLHCDEAWNVIATSGADSVEAVKARAERNYPGISARWVDTNISLEEALRYYDEEWPGLMCSFWCKRPFEVEGVVEGPGVAICRACVEDCYQIFHPPDEGATPA